MKFIDSTRLFLKSGNGGNGCVAFRREKYIEFGGPAGGNGGVGGDVVIVGDRKKMTLFDLSCNPHQRAKSGTNGSGKDRTGAQGENKIIRMPLGTILIDDETGEVLMELMDETPQILIAGGKGGKGNIHFKSSTNRAPRKATKGEPGIEKTVRIDLRLIADVGLIGLPNAGKSLFISAVSASKAQVADYPFTTLVPNLGVVALEDYSSFVIADIPGIIEKAHKGTGLGIQFLKHIRRTSALTFLLDCSAAADYAPKENYALLLNELKCFSVDLLKKKRMVLLTKMDVLSEEINPNELIAWFAEKNIPAFAISAVRREGLKKVTQKMFEMIKEHRQELPEESRLRIGN